MRLNVQIAEWKRSLTRKTGYGSLANTLVSILGDSIVYLTGTALLGLATFILVPLYTRHLSPAEFGRYALIEVALVISITVAEMGLGNSYLRWFAEIGEHQRGALLGSSLAAATVGSVVCGVALAFTASDACRFWQAAALHSAWTLAPLVWLGALEHVLFSDLRARRRSVAFVVTALVRLLVVVGASLWFVAVRRDGVDGIFYGRLAGDVACVLMAAGFSLWRTAPRITREFILPLLRFGLPLVWSSLMGLLLDASGRYFLAHYSSLDDVGIYAVGIKISNLMSTIYLQPFGFAWASFVYQIARMPNPQITYTRVLGYAFLGAAALASICTLFAPFLTLVFAPRSYLQAQWIIPFLVLPLALRILEYWVCVPIYLCYKTHWVAAIGTLEVGLCLVLNWALIPRFGMYGAAFAWILALAGGIVVTEIVGRKYYRLPLAGEFLLCAGLLWGGSLLIRRLMPSVVSVASFLALVGLSGAIIGIVAAFFYFDFRATKALLSRQAYAD